MSDTPDLNRVVEGNRFLQLQDDSSTRRALVLQDEEARTQIVESEVQARLKATTQQLRQEFQELQAQLARNKEWTCNIENEHEGPLKRAKEKLFREIRNLRAKLTSKDEDDKATILKVKSECDALRQDLEAAEKDLGQRVAYFRDKVKSLELLVGKKMAEIGGLKRMYAYQKGQLKAKQDTIDFLKKEASHRQKQLKAKELQLYKVNAEKNALQAVFDDEEMALRLQKIKADKDQLHAALNDASVRTEADVAATAGLRLQLAEEQHKRKQLRIQVQNLMLRIEELTAERERSAEQSAPLSFWGKVKKSLAL